MPNLLVKKNSQRLEIDRLSAGTARRRIEVEAGGSLLYCLVGQGGGERSLEINLRAGANAQVFGFFIGSGQEKFDLRVTIHHLGRGTRANVKLAGALAGRAHSVFHGLIDVPAGMAQAEAFLEQRVLLLDRTAEAEAWPGLEVATSDAKAGHAVAVGELDQGSLFYVLSRGLSKRAAARMLIKGFLSEPLACLSGQQRQALVDDLDRAIKTLV